jgi:RES domain-containing protein
MIFDQDLLDALEDLPPEPWEGEVWRVVLGVRDPTVENRRGARWNPPETSALYTSLDKATVLAELDHMRTIQTPPLRRSQYTLHRVRVRVDRMLDLTDRKLLESFGIGHHELASDDHSACRTVGGAPLGWGSTGSLCLPLAQMVDQAAEGGGLELGASGPIHRENVITR